MSQLDLFTVTEADSLPSPIAAKCKKCGFNMVGREAIVAPSLEMVRCFWCGSEVRAHRGERDFAVADKHHETTIGRRFAEAIGITYKGCKFVGFGPVKVQYEETQSAFESRMEREKL